MSQKPDFNVHIFDAILNIPKSYIR